MPSTDARAMLKKDTPNVFPLHLAPIDSFFCADDRPFYPMTSVIQLDFIGQIQPDVFEAALDDGLARHPLLRAVIRPTKRSLPCWVGTPEARPQIDWGPIDKPVECPDGEAIDLSRQGGLRIWGRYDNERARIVVQVHHACTDGTGVYRFLGDVLACYGIRVHDSGEPPELANVDPRLLRNRRTRMARAAIHGTATEFVRNGARQAWDVFGRRVETLFAPHDAPKGTQPLIAFPGVRSHTFERDAHRELRAAAGRMGVMLNDLLLMEMFRSILEWNERHSHSRSRGWLRIMMPFDLRTKQDYDMPAANMTAYTFITRKIAQCHDSQTLLRSIREETAQIKHGNLGTSFVDALMFADYSPKIFQYLLNRDRCLASTILSNVGDPSRRFTAKLPRRGGKIQCGSLILDKVSGVPPLRPRSHATFAVFTYAREMTISMRSDPFRFQPDESQALLDLYVQRLAQHLG